MTLSLFSVLALFFATWAVFTESTRVAILALFGATLSTGCAFLTLGAEFLAIIQWLLGVATAIVLFFYAALFGELQIKPKKSIKNRVIDSAAPILLGSGFSFAIYLGLQDLLMPALVERAGPVNPYTLDEIGKFLIEKQFIAVEIFILFVLMGVVGAGVASRVEKRR